MTVLGTISAWLAALLALWGAIVGFLGLRRGRAALLESARRAAVALNALLGLSLVSLLAAFLRRDFNVAYVAEHASRTLGGPYLAAAIAAGWQGKVLIAALLFGLPLLLPRGRPPGELIAALGLLLAAAVVMVIGESFARLATTPLDGRGLDPVLLDTGFLVGPPLVLLGYAALATAAARLAGSVIAAPASAGAAPNAASAAVGAWVFISAGLMAEWWWADGIVDIRASWYRDPAGTGAVPVWLVLTAVLGAAWILSARRPATRRRSRGWVAPFAAGLLLLAVAALGARLAVEREIHLKPGETAVLRSPLGLEYRLTHMGVSRFETIDRFVTAATLDVRRGDRSLGLVSSERRQYLDVFGRAVRAPVTRAGIHRGPVEDLRVVLLEHGPATEEAVYRVRVQPFLWCAWVGASFLIAGGALALVPVRA